MAEERIQKTLEIRAEYSQAIEGIAKYRMELDRAQAEAREYTASLKDLEKQYKSGAISEQQYINQSKEIQKTLAANRQEQDQYKRAIAASEKVVRNQIATQQQQDGSLKALRAELSNLTKEYDEMGRAAREGAEGMEKLRKITEVTKEIKEAEEATQRYYRNVGNYKSALEGMEQATNSARDSVLGFISGGNPLVQMLANTAQQLGSVKQAFALAGQGAVMLGKQLLALIATPIGAFLALITAAFFALKNGIASSEERMNKFKVLMAPFKMALDVISNALGKVCGWLLNMAEGIGDAIMWVNKLCERLPVLGESFKKSNAAIKEYVDIEKLRQEIVKKERDEITKTAERENQVAQLRAKVAEKDKYTAKERLQFLDEAIRIETEQAEVNKQLAKDRLEALEREAALADNDKEMNDALARAKAEVTKADTDLFNKTRELNAQRVEAINAIKQEQDAYKKALAEKKKSQEEALKKEEELWRKAEDSIIALIQDNYERQRQQVSAQYMREIEDLQEQLQKEKDLTESAKEAIKVLIINKQKEMNAELAKIDKAKDAEEIQRKADMAQLENDIDRQAMQNRLNALKEGSIQWLEESKRQADEEHALRQEEISRELQQEKDRIAKLQISEQEKNAMLELAQREFNEKSIAIDQERTSKQKEISEAEKKMRIDAFNAMQSAMDAMGEHSKAFAVMSKMIALGEIAVNTGKAIAAGVAGAMAVPFPANIPAIVTTIATIMANIATAISTVKSAKFAKGGLVEVEKKHHYAGGGFVSGAGSGTSDSIHAMLSNGESVMTAAATRMYAPILSALNQSAGGNAIGSNNGGEEMLARAVARGMAAAPAPVVTVEEINKVNKRVKVLTGLVEI